jgi:hypothetical protein
LRDSLVQFPILATRDSLFFRSVDLRTGKRHREGVAVIYVPKKEEPGWGLGGGGGRGVSAYVYIHMYTVMLTEYK